MIYYITRIPALLFFSFFFINNSLFSQNFNTVVIQDLEIANYNFGSMNWNDAKNKIISLGDDWRLPTSSELYFKIFPNRFNNGLNVNASVYWSSTESNFAGTSSAEYVNLGNGYMSADLKSSYHFVIAVRNNSTSTQSALAYGTTTTKTITWKGQKVNFDEVFWSKDEHYEGYGFISESEMRYYKHGQGTTYLGEGAYIKGNYVRNKLQGQGEEFWPKSGQRYVGDYKDDKWDGVGTLTTAWQHETKYGYFNAGEFNSSIQNANNQTNEISNTANNNNPYKTNEQNSYNVKSNNIAKELQSLLDNKCFPRGTVVPMTSVSPQYKYAIKVESKKIPGKFRFFFIDHSVYEYDDDNTKSNFHRLKTSNGSDASWTCDEIKGQSNSQICNIKFTIPALNYQIVDNRTLCICCNEKYSIYDLKNLNKEKQNAQIHYLQILLNKHFEKTNADENHKAIDRRKLMDFVSKNYGIDGDLANYVIGPFAMAESMIANLIGADLLKKDVKIEQYKINSKYCSNRCKNDPRCQ